MNRVKQIGLSSLMYADEHKQYIPKTLTSGAAPIVNWMTAYVEYMTVKNRHTGKIVQPIYFCPLLNLQKYPNDTYGMNWRAGAGTRRFTDALYPDKALLIAEKSNTPSIINSEYAWITDRHAGGQFGLYQDIHVDHKQIIEWTGADFNYKLK